MKNIVFILNILISISIVILVLVQGKGAGLGSAWGGSGEMYQTRRGVEKVTLQLTVILIVLFFALSVFNLFLRS